MVEVPSYQNHGWNTETKECTPCLGFGYYQEHRGKKPFNANPKENCVHDILNKSTAQDVKERIHEPRIFDAVNRRKNTSTERRLNNIFQICLEPRDLSENLSLTSPKNFVVHYFTVSRNHPVKSCCRSQCPSAAGQSLGKQEGRQPARSELPRCKGSQIATRDQFSQCANPWKGFHDASVDSTACSNSIIRSDNSNQDHGLPCGRARKDCSPDSSSDSCCTSRTFVVKSQKVKQKHALQQTEPEPSWQARCSNFIVNLPVTLSEKLFGPRVTCEALGDSERTICDDDSRINRSQPVPKNTSEPGSRDQSKKKSVKSGVNSLTDHGCDKNIGIAGVFVERANQVEPCYSRTSQSYQEDVPCRRCPRKSEKSNVNCEKVNSKCSRYREDDCARLEAFASYSDSVHSRRSEPHEPRSNCGGRSRAGSSIFENKNRWKTSPSLSNWPAILSKKFFSPRNGRAAQCCVLDGKGKHERVTDEVEDSLEIVPQVNGSTAMKKGRLLLKKYTISQTPEATEETLCFEILPGKQLTKTRSKLHSQICVRMSSDKQKKLETIEEWSEQSSENSGKKKLETGKSRSSRPCRKSTGNVTRTSSRKSQRLEKKTSTEHIFFSNLITKLLNKHENVKEVFDEKKFSRNAVGGKSRGKGAEQYGKKCTFKRKTNTISRKYATTSIYKHKNKSVKCSRYIENGLRKNEGASCSLEKNVSPACCSFDFSEVSAEDNTRRKVMSDFSSGGERVSGRKSRRTFAAEDNLDENVEDLGKKGSQIMSNYRASKFEGKLTHEEDPEGCDSCGSCGEDESLVESGVAKVTDKSCRRESKELRCSALHRRKREAKSDTQEIRCRKISSPKKFSCRVQRRNEIECNSLQLACREIPECVAEGMQRTFVIAGENICVRMFHDRDTCTDDLSESAHCQNSNCLEKRRPNNQDLPRNQTTLGENIGNCLPPSQKTEQNGIGKVVQSSKTEIASRDSEVSYPQSRAPDKGPLSEQNGNSNTRKQPENAMRIRVDCGECVGSLCEDDACRVRPRRISESEDIRKAERDVGKVFCSLSQEAHGERGKRVCERKSCLYTDLIKSETEEALEISRDADSSQRQSTAAESTWEVNDCPAPLMATEAGSPEREGDRSDEPSNQNKAVNENPNKSERLDEVHARIGSPEKRSGWIKSRGTDLTVTIPEPRNIINACYSQRKNVLPPRCEVRNNEYVKVKKGNVKRDGSVLEKNCTKARKPFQRIENVKEMECTANVAIKDDKSRKRNTFEKENSIVDTTTHCQYSVNGNVFDNYAKNHLVQNFTLANSSFRKSSLAISSSDHASSVQELGEKDSASHEMRTAPSKIPKKSRPLIKSKSPEQVSLFATQTLENSSEKLKKSSHKSWSKKTNGGTANGTTDAKGTVKETEKIAQSAESESPNRLTRSINTCNASGSEKQKELQLPVYISDNANAKVRALQIEMSNVKEQNILNRADSRDAGRVEKGRESRKSGKLASLQSNGTQKVDGRSFDVASAKESRENKRLKGNQSKSKPASKKNENDKKSTPPKVLSGIDSEIDASSSTQRHVRMDANLFANAQTEGRSNAKSYRDLQSAVQENSNSNRTSASTDEELRKSGTAMTRSKPKISNSSKGNKISAKKTSEKSQSVEKPRNFNGNTNKTAKTAEIPHQDRTENLSRTSPGSSHIESSDERVTGDSGPDKVDITGGSLIAEASRAKACTSRSCRNNANHARNFESRLSAENLEEIAHVEERSSPLSRRDRMNCNVEKSPAAEREVLPTEISNENSSVCTSSKEPSHERLPCKSRGTLCHTKNRKPSLSSRISSDSDQEMKQGALKDVLRPQSPRYEACKDRNSSESNYAGESLMDPKNMKNQGIHRSAKTEDAEHRSEEVIAKIANSVIPKVQSDKFKESECNGVNFKRLCKGFLSSGMREEEEEIIQGNNVPEKLKTSCTPGKVISDSSDRNFSFTDDLKRFLDQGQEFFSLKRKENCKQTTSCSDGERNPSPCDGGKFNTNEARCKRSEFCRSVDYEKMNTSAKICGEGKISNDSISSLQKVYGTLKTILNKTKSFQKGFMNAKQSKETQISTPIIDESSSLRIKNCIKLRENSKSSEPEIFEGDESPTVSISFGSSIFNNLNLRDSKKTNNKQNVNYQ